jgi:hypothetical protein
MNRRASSVPGTVKVIDPMEDAADIGSEDDRLLATLPRRDRDAFRPWGLKRLRREGGMEEGQALPPGAGVRSSSTAPVRPVYY